jgi:hypothetical protein
MIIEMNTKVTDLTNGIANANALYRSGKYKQALLGYEQVALRPGWERLVQANIALCRKKLQFDSLAKFPEIVVTLTTIKSRVPYLTKVIASLLAQTLRPIRIDLNLSREP